MINKPKNSQDQSLVLNRRDFCVSSLGAAFASMLAPSVIADTPDKPATISLPQRKWELFVIQHSHIDLGFTDRQEVIADYHRQFVRQAVEMALSPNQKRRQKDCQFKYTIEGFWSLEQFLRSATKSEQRQLTQALKSGLIELTAGYFHLTELLDMDVLRWTFQPAQRFARQKGISLAACMSCDVNGFSWGFCELLAEVGVRYLSTNINSHHGGAPLGKPLTPFYWESPSGKRVLVWNGLPYHRANVLGLMGYYSPDTDLGFPGLDLTPSHRFEDVKDISMAERKLLPVLMHLEKSGYPYNFMPLMGNAIYTDNGPAGDQSCELIRQWNERYGSQVHIQTATLAEFFRHLEQHVREIPTYRGDWTDWWSDGVAATPLDTLLYRNAQRTRHLVRLLDPKHQVIKPKRIEEIDQRLALYAEHTFGYSNTSSHSLLTHQVFTRKSLHAIQADELAGQALVEVLRWKGEGEFSARRPFTYKVINPLNRPVRAAVQLPTDYWEDPVINRGVSVVDSKGTSLPCQVEPAPRGRVIVTQVELSPGSELDLRIESGPKPSSAPESSNGFSNQYYHIKWDKEQGIYSLVDSGSGKEMLGPGKGGLGSPIYQIFPKGNRGAAAGFGYTKRSIPKDEVTIGRCTGIKRVKAGNVFERWEFSYEVPGTRSYFLDATFYKNLPHIELSGRVVKLDVTDPEGLYLAFPFDLKDGVWHLDKPGASIRPAMDQLPGSCCDYYCVQAGAALVGPAGGIVWTTLDAPLVHIGKLRLWNYATSIQPTGPIYSWLTNNKWETNFKLTCGGNFEFRYVMQCSSRFKDSSEALAACRAFAMAPVVIRH